MGATQAHQPRHDDRDAVPADFLGMLREDDSRLHLRPSDWAGALPAAGEGDGDVAHSSFTTAQIPVKVATFEPQYGKVGKRGLNVKKNKTLSSKVWTGTQEPSGTGQKPHKLSWLAP